MAESEIQVPSYFLCPISLEIMKDPVTISTGTTFDREGIEKWIFSHKNNTCPLTKQPLSDTDLTPNVTLRRLIQSWCTLHAVERLPTPKPPVTEPQLLTLLAAAAASTPESQIKCLHCLRSIASANQTNRICMEKSGAADFLAAIVAGESVEASEEALSILYSLRLSESALKSLASRSEFIACLIRLMQSPSYESRAYAVMMLESITEVEFDLINSNPQILIELIQILKDQICKRATRSALKMLITLCAWGRNRIKSAEAGLVGVVIDLLLDNSSDKRTSEMILTVLDLVCQCAEGRAELVRHGAGLAVVSKKILRVSEAASERAVRVLHSVSKFSGTGAVVQEMAQIGAVAKLCLVLQVECGMKTKERARDILKMHARAWRNSSCVPNTFASFLRY